MRVLVTGGCGFIGAAIVRFLVSMVDEVVVLDSLITGRREHVDLPQVTVYIGDVCDTTLLNMILQRHQITHICHQAALGSVPRSHKEPLLSHTANVHALAALLTAAHTNGIRRCVYASSSSIYGHSKSLSNRAGCARPASVYALTKHVNEQYAHMWSSVFGMETIGLRYHNVIGETQPLVGAEYSAVLPKLIHAAHTNSTFFVYGDGEQTRDFTHVDNVVYANWLALTTTNTECFGKAMDIGTGEPRDLHHLIETVESHLGFQITCSCIEERTGDVRYSCADLHGAKSMLNYVPIVRFAEAIERILRYRSNVSYVRPAFSWKWWIRTWKDRVLTSIKRVQWTLKWSNVCTPWWRK